ncbi:Asp23/Gls24 family envelope stress response protein [Amycolatopsis sp. 195334CR]|uniref:Asp23/Gls24 family envelope stress response protein n=1 Tax=Amycolatopsis sp. 195334CR TaxID=2814588 RepID=UPI001A90A0D4|nr:Asp23/Gls24 family envelope stress response protein [Amycolatopsis sp. 195334CR]MBN6042062.1 Asp23/Gls24 family envelope stress response protein [Amycolatopsis sp. 195334CR]
MAMNQAAESYPLPCGRDVEAVWDRLDEVESGRADEHDLSCEHCRAAREGLLVLRSLTGELAREAVEPPPDLVGRIMSAVRAEVRRHDLLPLPTPEPGQARVSDRAVAAILRFAADSVDGVRARACKVDVTFAGAFEVHLEVAVSYHAFAADALDTVRERVSAAAVARVGVTLAQLDIRIADLYED